MLPLVSVGMPVYNGEKYIREALDSLLAQSYANLEIIISDNASTDDTWLICQDFARRDARIRCYQNAENIGIFNNFQRVIDLAKGKYFMWFAHDDLCEPNLVAKQVGLLEKNPDVLICASNIKIIDESGNYVRDMMIEGLYPETNWQKARTEFFKHPPTNAFMSIYGMYVTEYIKKFGGVKAAWKGVTLGGEPVYLAQYALIGKIQSIAESLKVARIHKNSFSQKEIKGEGLSEFILRNLKIRWLLTKTMLGARLPPGEKTRLFLVTNWYNILMVFYYCPRYTLAAIKKGISKNARRKENIKGSNL